MIGGPMLGAQDITLRRYAVGSVGSDGRRSEGSSADTTISADVQDIPGRDRQLLPEGKRQSQGLRLYVPSANPLRTANQYTGTRADQVIVDSRVYDIIVVQTRTAIIPHCKALAILVQESE